MTDKIKKNIKTKNKKGQYKQLFDNMNEGFALHEIICDKSGRPVDYRFIEINPAFERLTGLKRSKVVGRRAKKIMPGLEPFWIETYGNVALTGKPATFENFSKVLKRWYQVHAYRPASRRFAVVFSDITERKRYEESLKQAKDEWEQTFDTVPDLIAIMNQEHKIIKINKPMAQRLGIEKEQAIGQYCYKIVHGMEKEASFCPHAQTCRDAKEHMVEVHEPKLGGDFMVSTTPICNRDGKFIGSVHVARDITERKHAELVLKRLSDIGALAATVAHELRNPLGVMRLAAYNIKRKDPQKLFSDNIANIEKTIGDSEQIINNLLYYSKIKPPSLKKVDLMAVLKESITQSRNKFKEWKAETKNNFNEFQPVFIAADPTQLREVFANILNNAFEALPNKKGRIEIECELEKENSEVAIKIKDDGAGIDPADLTEIFRPFFTRKTRGTGLGLAVCSQIAALHGGRIEAFSQKGEGAAFVIRLPLSEPGK
ncbi:hypothetical protein A2276_01955 [candidate division WOR-1 bacterium RIFOXYA12_FULL_43_27]|uniref:histidine kinase n=1 Tax=candidate division WOR-1 bacterium RIFOXYC2_FULL_46_14 TaxID=1802587 RepID=A0A1F4U6X4_UNCSA|nr:MAG: hypothetical protein A2276_01955 [candidate division WOR-1 bacterium RIFOXYA12_FULL_43_27]OGC19514.1 MAG: hypothetical protein A2292_02375 [candidate division WOR-1 bacterium RIFOXYB2_FULL_46_45]OGC30502.1 MAG: hypothetical protein A2232_02375 [candidate division WOR-1 bacterium RIFOXYA2_FULL_46_56]OGC40570.1 MAG: hypothetical protein A2438_06090 [candidate division WOR-1 bacterium RIFOXYC2_FULL_46_14]